MDDIVAFMIPLQSNVTSKRTGLCYISVVNHVYNLGKCHSLGRATEGVRCRQFLGFMLVLSTVSILVQGL